MAIPGLRLEAHGAVARIIFDRPDRANAIHPDWALAIFRFLREVEYDPAIRCVLISAQGKHFQAGGDLAFDKSLSPVETLGYAQDAMLGWNRMLIAIHDLRKPVVAAVQGGTVGASVALVAACDMVVASDDAFFIVAQSKIGASLDGLPSYFLPRKVGIARAMEWCLLSDRISALDAERAGLINRLVPRVELEDAAMAWCHRLAGGATTALGLSKRLLNQSLENSIHAQAAAEMEAYAAVVATEDWKEGINAFLEKRPAQFVGH
jgi:2-(1,2-epoxy-1,2-dihydrophenyl)acetyl-CoA isomerase